MAKIFDKIASRFGYAKTRDMAPIVASYIANMGYATTIQEKSYSQLVDAYKSWVYTSIDKIAKSVAMIPLALYVYRNQRTGQKMTNLGWRAEYKALPLGDRPYFLKDAGMKREQVYDHPFLTLINHPNGIMTRFMLWYETMIRLELGGMCGWLLNRNGLGLPSQIWPLPLTKGALLQPKVSSRAQIEGWTYRDGDVNLTFLPQDILIFKYPHPASPFQAMSPLMAQTYPYDIDLFLMQQQRALFENMAVPGLSMSTDQNLKKTQVDELKEIIDSQFAGAVKAGKTLVTHSGLKAQILGSTGRDNMIDEVERFARDKLITAYDLSPGKVGLVEDANRCLSEDTEALTKRGWVGYQDLTKEDLVATWNESERRMEYHAPNEIFVYDFDGVMHHWWNRRINFLCTPNHQMWFRTPTISGYKFLESKELARRSDFTWRITGGNLIGGDDSLHIPKIAYGATGNKGSEPEGECYEFRADEFAPFLGHYISEGFLDRGENAYRISIGQTSETEEVSGSALVMRDALRILPVNVREYHRPSETRGRIETGRTLHQFSFSDKSIYSWLAVEAGCGAENKRIPRCAFGWDENAKRLLLEAICLGDGHWYNEKTFGIVTKSEGLADDLQELGVQLGFMVSKQDHSTAECFNVIFSQHEEVWIKTEIRPEEVPYKGNVWCVDVPNHLFFTRRDGRVALHGNSNMEALNVSFVNECQRPKCMMMEEVLETFLLPIYDQGLTCDFELPDVGQKELQLQERRENLQYLLTSVNEERQKIGLEPKPWGDRPWASFTLAQIGGNAPAPAPASAPPSKIEVAPLIKSMSRDFWTPEKQGIAWKGFVTRSTVHEQMITGPMRAYFSRQAEEVIRRLDESGRKIVGQYAGWSRAKILAHITISKDIRGVNIDKREEKMRARELMTPLVKSVMKDAGDDRLTMLHETIKDFQLEFDVNDPRVLEWLGDRMRMFSDEVTNTSFDDIAAILREGFAAGEPLSVISQTLREKFESWDQYRAPLIARSETIASSNKSDLEAVSQAGLEDALLKHWLTAGDEAVRESHQKAGLDYADGIAIDEDFEVGGDQMESPGNGKAAGENINCRCTLYYTEKAGGEEANP